MSATHQTDSFEEAQSYHRDNTLMEDHEDGRGIVPAEEADETQAFIRAPEEDNWRPPRGFAWIEIAIFANVFLYGFDGTITASTYAVISSEFDAANKASWLTTSYLVTSTAFQPLYGRVSDIFGRRICFFISSITFGLGCLGCGVSNSVMLLNVMRALTGFGGGGLMTMGKSPRRDRTLQALTTGSDNNQL